MLTPADFAAAATTPTLRPRGRPRKEQLQLGSATLPIAIDDDGTDEHGGGSAGSQVDEAQRRQP